MLLKLEEQIHKRLQISFRLTACYLFGLIAGNLLFLPYIGIMAIPFTLAGAVIALPLLVVALTVLLIFRQSIFKYLLYWCLSAPLAVGLFWLFMEYALVYSNRGFGAAEFLTTRNVLERAFLALVCASASSLLFYFWNNKHVDTKTGDRI